MVIKECIQWNLSWETTATRDHLSWQTTHFWQKDLHSNTTEPVIRHYLSWQTTFFVGNGVVFQDGFYCIWNQFVKCNTTKLHISPCQVSPDYTWKAWFTITWRSSTQNCCSTSPVSRIWGLVHLSFLYSIAWNIFWHAPAIKNCLPWKSLQDLPFHILPVVTEPVPRDLRIVLRTISYTIGCHKVVFLLEGLAGVFESPYCHIVKYIGQHLK